jgi:uncharacterized protein (TIGR03435 family)
MAPRRIGIVLAAAAALAHAQTGVAAAPAFEVASIKPSGPQSVRGSEGGPGHSDPGLYRFGSASLLDLIIVAYDVEVFQVSSSFPLERQNFDFVAKVPAGATKQQFRAMLQNFLAERFQLKLHIQSREFPAYELVVAKTGLKLKEAVTGESTPAPQSHENGDWPYLSPDRPGIAARFSSTTDGSTLVRLRSRQEPLSLLAQMLHNPDDLPVVDKTGLTGKYDFTLEYATDLPRASPDGSSDPPLAPSLFTALQQQLGLQLVRKKLPFHVLIIDAVNKLPTEN